ncbi:protein FD-like [Abrus precatorius]|uniref:Protein FD-like n=1 Tax=Abrus precatorius TaxID=3816 RepID=A0A8B8KVQ1_ABRPR|nr:protein FD-like [Abrus precatorius]
MLSSSTTKGECTCSRNRKTLNNRHRGCSSSSSTSKPPTSSFSLKQNNKAMDDVWEDINLASLSDQNSTQHPITTTDPQGANFQDFLSRPLTNFSVAIDPATALSLSTRPELTHKDLQLAQPHHNPPLKVDPFQNRAHSCASFGNNTKKSLQPDTNSGDRRNTRMMKNRESAARSRAYMFELKQKVKLLQEENARLRRQQQRLCETAANQRKKKGNLYRASTAPF